MTTVAASNTQQSQQTVRAAGFGTSGTAGWGLRLRLKALAVCRSQLRGYTKVEKS